MDGGHNPSQQRGGRRRRCNREGTQRESSRKEEERKQEMSRRGKRRGGRQQGGRGGSRGGQKGSGASVTPIVTNTLGTDQQYGSEHKAQSSTSHSRRAAHGRSHGRSRDSMALTSVITFSQSEINELLSADDQSVTRQVTQNEKGFLKTLKECRSPIVQKNLVKLLYKLVKCKGDNQLAHRILVELFGSGEEYSSFLFQLDQLVKKMPSEKRHTIRDENLVVLFHLTEIGRFCVATIPRTVEHTFPVHSIKTTAGQLFSTSIGTAKGSLESIQESMIDLEVQLQNMKEQHTATSKPKLKRSVHEEEEPPENFTSLPILPLCEEINNFGRPYLRANIVEGSYHSWDHYLDVQFRLLREDFIGPLREGITKYLVKSSRQGGEVRVYYNVTVEEPVCLALGMGFEIHFDTRALRRVNWEYTKRLINGSLLCLSMDDFNSISFATVAQRDAKSLDKGNVIVKFEGITNGFHLIPNAKYTMVESVAYFEAYRHVLEKLIATRENNEIEAMPFKQYIVDCLFDRIPLPQYLSLGETMFDLRGVIEIKNRTFGTKVNLADLKKWPDSRDTNLNPSQMRALQAALTQEISVIQGPPGTGKTYVGMKIVKAFLANRGRWDPKKTTPILVVCYTNHALDQFLEGVRSDEIDGKRPNVTRIGGRCKSEILQDCTLYEKVSRARKERIVPKKDFIPFVKARESMNEEKEVISKELEGLKVSKYKILHLKRLAFADVILKEHYKQLEFKYDTTDSPIEVWLGLQYEQITNPPAPIEMPNSQLTKDTGKDSFNMVEANYQQNISVMQNMMETLQLESQQKEFEEDTEVQMINDDRQVEGTEIVFRATEIEDTKHTKNPQRKDSEGWQVVQMSEDEKRKLIKRQLSSGLKPMSNREMSSISNIWSLSRKQKWRLYITWKERYITYLRQKLSGCSEDYRRCCEEFHHCRQNIDLRVIEGSDVVGMTTTGAAKHNYIVKSIRPKIVVVEEAAEIFEPHIFTSLSPAVQQLILIGDHQQLRPKPTYYELEANYNFNVSLFERLAMNGCPVQRLGIQHRMRPEIASLITPAIYEELQNHESVEKYAHVKGVGKNVFFISHTEQELTGDDDRKSHSNPHEAEFIGALCDYLLKQGYKQNDVTILTLYRGQHLLIKNCLKARKIQGVRTAVVDDFQGEENEIILLSLVRSNREQRIGFVGIENRICVSLSRAKIGLYIIGNELMLRDNIKTVWPQVLKQLSTMDCIGKALPLYCQLHPDYKIQVQTTKDFLKCPEGGCMKKCISRLPCGHICPRLCHPYDRDHTEFKCTRKCEKQLKCGHECKWKCYECYDGCQPCKTQVTKQLACGHSQKCDCSKDPEEVKCSKHCEKTLPCGHLCQEKCSSPCTPQCTVKIEKDLPCGHTIFDACYLKEEAISCPIQCNAMLDCEHKCSGTCYSCEQGRLHVRCTAKCNRPLSCGHICHFPCTSSCPPCDERCANFCVHSSCPKMCFEPCAPCMERCEWSCPHFKCTQPCGMPCDRPPCDKPCPKFLQCGHRCIGLCGEVCPPQCRHCDNKEVTALLFGNEGDDDARFILLPDCNHIVEVRALDHWMSTENTSTADPEAVTLKVCPWCKTPVRQCLRYGNDIKARLKDIEAIKVKQLSAIESVDLQQEYSRVKDQSKDSPNFYLIRNELKVLGNSIEQTKSKLFPHVLKAQFSFLLQIVVTHDILMSAQGEAKTQALKDDLYVLKKFVMQKFLSQQQMSDAETEIRRLTLSAKLTELQFKLIPKQQQVSIEDSDYIQQAINKIHLSRWKREKVSMEQETQVLTLIDSIRDKYSVDKLSDTERLEIVKAIGLPKGHWYKCPNGHYYVIGECGGAMQRGQCPECKSSIGGMNHTLQADNQHAPEMDGSRHAAWSEAANLANFDPQEFMD